MNLLKLSALLLLALSPLLQAQPKCSNTSLNGTLFYMIGGTVKNGTTTPSYAEQGYVVADGSGGLSGTTNTSTAGVILTGLAVSGTYTVHADCSGTMVLNVGTASTTLTMQVVDGGSLVLSSATSSAAGELGELRLYRAANATGSQCGNGSLSGAYGILLSGGTFSGGIRTPYNAEIQAVFDGNGNVTTFSGEVTTDSTNGPSGLNASSGTYTMTSNCSGTAQISLPNGTQLNYILGRVGTQVLFLESDVATTILGSGQPQLLQQVLPQFVFGANTWYSALYFSNPTSATVTFLVTFTSDSGNPLSVPGVGISKQVTIAANSTAIIEAQNSGAFGQGFASFSLPAGVTGYGVFRQTVAGRADQEALVGFKNANQTAAGLTFDETNGLVTTIALLNSSTVATTVTITVYDNAGNTIGTALQAVPPGQKVAAQLDKLTNLGNMVGKRGSASFTVATGNVSVLALRFDNAAFTSIPTTQLQ
jgi:hypothetical protein